MISKKVFKYFYIFILATVSSALSAQVTIGGALEPSKGALLDLKEFESKDNNVNSTKGLMLPRVDIQNINELYPMFSNDADYNNSTKPEFKDALKQSHIGLMVYNTNECLGKGLMVWNGTMWNFLTRIKSPLSQPNTYLLTSSPQTIRIPVEKAFAIWEYYGSEKGNNRLPSNIDLGGTLSAEIVWQEGAYGKSDVIIANPPTVTQGRNGEITVVTTGNVGNAVIALKIGGNIRWSWHVWVSEGTVSGNKFPDGIGLGYIFMDRNLGATSALPANAGAIGLHYQWGRKDPFPGYVNFNSVKSKVPIDFYYDIKDSPKENFQKAIESPLSFISYTQSDPNSSGDWYNKALNNQSTAQDVIDRWDDRWGSYDCDAKSPFDPCPEGWQVPKSKVEDNITISPWRNIKVVYPSDSQANKTHFNNNKGYNYGTEGGYWPGTWARFYNQVLAATDALVGFYWSMELDKNVNYLPHDLQLNASSIAASSSYPRSFGLAIRCVKE
ncbi:hypothetical protein CLV62_14011 [Dysgonomonas alginatilytica]|uniref:Fibrobacter succinogenes major paralogous domain-containing protein n=1 Tax=Dysgonomonas alginatilytica TaxID=1605892 RepID=A0A2V3PK90_9BACT|nr:hypothetical protein [Dysgonomonas alginatilytica]PXV58936.1 hypothetical protein CLV62_14011 [Dysgonomonas alginatilytica]